MRHHPNNCVRHMRVFPRVIILTGEKGVGKSSIVRSLLTRTSCAVGGFLSEPVTASAQRVAYELVDLQTGERQIFARRVPWSCAPRGGPFLVDRGVFEGFGAHIVRGACRHADLVVMDEIGCMEDGCPAFRKAVTRCLASGVPALAVVQQGECAFVKELLAAFRHDIVPVSAGEEERVWAIVLAKLREWGVSLHE
ncbi:MAG: nucleoside-triphosphatase [Candidatus Oleimicrobiaceae bacterium]